MYKFESLKLPSTFNSLFLLWACSPKYDLSASCPLLPCFPIMTHFHPSGTSNQNKLFSSSVPVDHRVLSQQPKSSNILNFLLLIFCLVIHTCLINHIRVGGSCQTPLLRWPGVSLSHLLAPHTKANWISDEFSWWSMAMAVHCLSWV